MDYGEAYSLSTTLYGEHAKMLDHFQNTRDLTQLLLPFERRIVGRIGRETNIRSIVDLGCGTGRFLRAVEGTGVEAVGYEIVPNLVEMLQRYGRRAHHGGIEEFLASNERPDAISLLEVVEHLPKPGAAIRRLIAEKRPRLLFVVVPAWRMRRRFDTRFTEHDVPPNHLTWWDQLSLSKLLDRDGYRVSVETVSESRRSLLGHSLRNRGKQPAASFWEWVRAVMTPPAFWLLATAERS